MEHRTSPFIELRLFLFSSSRIITSPSGLGFGEESENPETIIRGQDVRCYWKLQAALILCFPPAGLRLHDAAGYCISGGGRLVLRRKNERK